jgi:hypothetical protein
MPIMTRRFRLLVFTLFSIGVTGIQAETPSLLVTALQRWSSGEGDLAFTQQTKIFLSSGMIKEERIERYDPSLPDSRRWRLIEVNGVPATQEQRAKWESRKNGKPRRKVDESPSEYLDLDRAVLVGETSKDVRFRIPLKPEAQRLLDTENIEVVITVDRQTGNVAGIGAALREPIRVLLGVARITDLDVDLRINPVDDASSNATDEVESGSTARVRMSKLGRPVEYDWSDFKRVASYPGS